jgi:hypothetical protein
LVTQEEGQHLDSLIADFLQAGGEGEALHRELHELAKETPTSWLEGFWDTWYLEPRCALPINVNPGFLFRDGEKEVLFVDSSSR